MTILKYFCGYEGSYTFLGVPVKATHKPIPVHEVMHPALFEGSSIFSKLALACHKSRVFRLIAQSDLHIFVHEISHLVAIKKLMGLKGGALEYSLRSNELTTISTKAFDREVKWKKTLVFLAGPMGNIAFSTCKLVAATAFKSYLPWPVTVWLGGVAVVWIAGELFAAYSEMVKKGSQGSCVGEIIAYGPGFVLCASACIVGEVALGVFLAVKCAR